MDVVDADAESAKKSYKAEPAIERGRFDVVFYGFLLKYFKIDPRTCTALVIR